MIRHAISLAAVVLVLTLPAQGAEVTVGALKISTAWSRATPKGADVGGGYLTITNTGSTSDRLVSAQTSISTQVQVHEMKMEKGVMKMRMLDGGLEIKPGQTVKFAPGGYHMMFMGLKQPLKKGDHFKATLEFATAGKVEVDFKVEALGAGKPATHGGAHGQPGMKH